MAVHQPHHVGQSRRLMRSRRSIWFSGVCGGLGEYLGIDPSFIRLAFGLLGGFGLVAYIAAWIVIPLAPREDAEPAGSAPGLQGITIGLLLACAVLAAYLLATPNTMTVGTGILLAPAVIAIGAALVRPARLTQKGALVILGLALTTLLTIANFNPAFGDRIEQPTSPVELTHGYSNAFGTMTLDLTGLNFGQGHLRVRANTVFASSLSMSLPTPRSAVTAIRSSRVRTNSASSTWMSLRCSVPSRSSVSNRNE